MTEFPQSEDVFKPYHEPKPWGAEFVWALTEHYAAKTLFIEPGRRLSLQLHDKKEETIFVEFGPVLVTWGKGNQEPEPPFEVETGGVIHIRPGVIHRFEAPEGQRVILWEVSTPHLDDVVRIEDDYERAPSDTFTEDVEKIAQHGRDVDAFIRGTAHRDFSS